MQELEWTQTDPTNDHYLVLYTAGSIIRTTLLGVDVALQPLLIIRREWFNTKVVNVSAAVFNTQMGSA